jgi:hypothetical protein
MSFQPFPALVVTADRQDGEIGGCKKKDDLIARGCVGWLRLDTGPDLLDAGLRKGWGHARPSWQ